MNRFKKTAAILMAICLILLLSACCGGKEEYDSMQGFEFHFYPEEYEEEYSEVSKTLSLEADTDYQLKIAASCESGTMEISVKYADGDTKDYAVNADTPCKDLMIIPANTINEVTITVSIMQDTKGTVIGSILSTL